MQVPPLDEDLMGDSDSDDEASEDEFSAAPFNEDLMGDFDSDDESEVEFGVVFSEEDNDDPSDIWEWGRGHSWEVPEQFKIISIRGANNPKSLEYHRLLNLLRHDNRKWDMISLDGEGQPSSPEFLSLLVGTFGKTEKLQLADCLDDASYACLNSGLLMATGGIQNIDIWTSPGRTIMEESQMYLLSQGLSMTTSLETLVLPNDLTAPGVVEHLIAGLKANTSLNYLESNYSDYPPGTLPLVIAALSSHPNLSRLMLQTEELRHSEVQEALQTLLSRDDCKLESVDLMRRDSRSGLRQNDTTSSFNLGKFHNPNTPLKSLNFSRLAIDGSALCAMLPSCRHLLELDLSDNDISNLEPLDCLLLGESCTLERLMLNSNPISLDNARIFAKKLPKMKVLRQLDLRQSPFLEDKEFLEEFIGYSNQNTSLDVLRIFTKKSFVEDLWPKLMYGPCLNRAGRRYLGRNLGSLPLNLLPIVLVRARETLYYNPLWSPEEPTERLDGLDAAFWLLRENDNFLSHLH